MEWLVMRGLKRRGRNLSLLRISLKKSLPFSRDGFDFALLFI
jgi:hypothetical protein